MKKSYDRIGNFRISGRFTIGSGIITTTPTVMLKFAQECEALGIITSKSIGPKPRKGYPSPIISQENEYVLMNAVGLANPGIEAYVSEMRVVRKEWPEDKFLLTSIFAGDKKTGDVKYGDTKKDLVYVAEYASEVSNGLELNFGCPHSSGLAQIGRSPELVGELTAAVVDVVDIPVIPKLTPSAYDIAAVAKAAEKAGASGIAAINTVGPGATKYLSTGIGSISGPAIKSIGVRCVREIANAVDLPIIGMGGISNFADVLDYKEARADFFGIGSRLISLITAEDFRFFGNLNDIFNGKEKNNTVRKCKFDAPQNLKIESIEEIADDLCIIKLDDYAEKAMAGQFMMLQPKGGEAKPFSIADDNPLTFAVRKVGDTTSKINLLKQGDSLIVSGPYGTSFELMHHSKETFLVGGGTGIAPLNFIAKDLLQGAFKTTYAFIGAKTKDELIFEKSLREKIKKVFVSTDDGSYGKKGFVTEALEAYLSNRNLEEISAPWLIPRKIYGDNPTFINCGPEVMIKKAVEIEKKYVENPEILCAVERYTKCGMGLCGSCEINGYRACVDGPIFNFRDIEGALGVYKRDATGKRIKT